jgi:hypothetical protein
VGGEGEAERWGRAEVAPLLLLSPLSRRRDSELALRAQSAPAAATACSMTRHQEEEEGGVTRHRRGMAQDAVAAQRLVCAALHGEWVSE